MASVPHGPWQTTTVIAALRAAPLPAPVVLDGPGDGPAFGADIEPGLAPSRRPGDSGVRDKLAWQKVARGRRATEADRARLRALLPYSPDFNPIEQDFAKRRIRPHALRRSQLPEPIPGTTIRNCPGGRRQANRQRGRFRVPACQLAARPRDFTYRQGLSTAPYFAVPPCPLKGRVPWSAFPAFLAFDGRGPAR